MAECNEPIDFEILWGMPAEQLPKPEPKDFFDVATVDCQPVMEAEQPDG